MKTVYKIIIFNTLGYVSIIAALLFLWSHFTDGAIDVEIGDTQKTVYFKPAHSLEIAIASIIVCIITWWYYKKRITKEDEDNKVIKERVINENSSPDEVWCEYLNYSLLNEGIVEIEKITRYLEEIGKFFDSYTLIDPGESSMYHIKLEIRGKVKDYPVRLHFTPFTDDLKLCMKLDVFPAYLQLYRKSGMFSEEKALSCPPDYLDTYISDYARSYELIFHLNYNLEAIPVKAEKDDPWRKDVMLKIFVANGVYMEAYEDLLNLHMAIFNLLNEDFKKPLLEQIIELELQSVSILQDEINICMKSMRIFKKPLSTVSKGLELLLRIAAEFETVPIGGELVLAKSGDQKTIMARLVTCSFCSTRYPLKDQCKCPNCGASYS